MNAAAPAGELLPKELPKGVRGLRLDSITAWRREVGKIYREMRAGLLPAEQATRQTYVAEIGAKLTRIEEELRLHRKAIDALQRSGALQSVPPTQLVELLGPVSTEGDGQEATQ